MDIVEMKKNRIYYVGMIVVIENIAIFIIIILIFFCMTGIVTTISILNFIRQARAQVGATQNMINELECKDYQFNMFSEAIEARCAICLNDYNENDKISFLPCHPKQHHFHKECINEWLKISKTCPYCKNPIDNKLEKSDDINV